MKQEQFLQIPFNILLTNKLQLEEKIIISYIISWQKTDKECTASNDTISKILNCSSATLKRIIVKLNSYSFFTSKRTYKNNFFGKIMTVNEEQFNEWLNDVKETEKTLQQPIITPSTDVKTLPLVEEKPIITPSTVNEEKQETMKETITGTTTFQPEMKNFSTGYTPEFTTTTFKKPKTETREEYVNRFTLDVLLKEKELTEYEKILFKSFIKKNERKIRFYDDAELKNIVHFYKKNYLTK